MLPAIEDDGVVLADSSVICAYLERTRPEGSIYPKDAAQFGHALWIEELVDNGLAPHLLRGLLMQRVFAFRRRGSVSAVASLPAERAGTGQLQESGYRASAGGRRRGRPGHAFMRGESCRLCAHRPA
jgi:glutathione S-transferase